MGRKSKQIVTITTNGTHKGTSLLIDDKPVYFESLVIEGCKENDFNVVIGLYMSKDAKQQVKDGCGDNAIGFQIGDDEYGYKDDEE